MELYQLKTFVAVAREGNLSRAAEKLFASLPAVSAQIKALEEEFGVKLFARTPKGMQLTEAGERLLEEAERALQAAQRLKSAAAEVRGEIAASVRLGTVSDPIALRLGEVMVKVAERHPNLRLDLHQDISGRVLNRVRKGELHCAYVMAHQEPGGVRATRLAPVDLAIALPKRYADGAAQLSLHDVMNLAWIGTPAECTWRPAVDELFRSEGVEPRFSVVADVESSLRSMVAAGLGCGVIRKDQALAAERVGEAVCWRGWSGQVALYWIESDAGDIEPALRAVREAVLDTWR